MKQIVTVALILLASTSSLFAQKKEQSEEIKKIISTNQERFVFELTHDRAFGDGAPEIASLSRGGNVYYMKNIPLGESRFSVNPGLGIANRQLYMKNVYEFSPRTQVVTLNKAPKALNLNSSKLNFTYFEIPIELKYATKPNKRGHSFKVGTGFRAGYLLASKFKYRGQVYEGDKFKNQTGSDLIYTEKLKIKKLENLIKYRIAPSFRVGYGSVNVFGLYHVNSDFEIDKGPKMNGYSIGVSISSF